MKKKKSLHKENQTEIIKTINEYDLKCKSNNIFESIKAR